MNVQELETAVRLGLNFLVVIFEDKSFGLIEWKQQKKFGIDFGVKFSNPDFVKLAESFGAKGYKITNTKDFKKICAVSFKEKVPVIVSVEVDYEENIKLMEKLGHLVCPI